MDIKKHLKDIQDIYRDGGNIIAALQKEHDLDANEPLRIAVSYDFQAGSYLRDLQDPQYTDSYVKYTQALANVINHLGRDEVLGSILEVGVGEGTTLGNVLKKIERRPSHIYGFDISWSRVRFAHTYLKEQGIDTSGIVMGDLFSAPFADNSIDIVYTSHSLEPNGGREKEALEELYRITRRYLVLLEPAYDFASDEAKKRMEEHGYVRNIRETVEQLGYTIVEHRLFDYTRNPLNPTGLTIIAKEPASQIASSPLSCPLTRTPLELMRGSYFSREGMLVYPVVDNIPCLMGEHAIIATHFGDFN